MENDRTLLLFAYAVLMVGVIWDVVSTVHGLNAGFTESNPVGDALWQWAGAGGLLVSKITAVVLWVAWVYVSSYNDPWMVRWNAWLTMLIGAGWTAAGIYNTVLILTI